MAPPTRYSHPRHYADDGTYTVSLTITDNDRATTTERLTINAQNVNPVLNTFTGNLTPNEGQLATSHATASDLGDDTITYTWDFGDSSEVKLSLQMFFALNPRGRF